MKVKLAPQGHNLILTFNIGSSSLKFSVFQIDEPAQPQPSLNKGNLTPILSGSLKEEEKNLKLKIKKTDSNEIIHKEITPDGPEERLNLILSWLKNTGYLERIFLIGHRIVHGGPRYTQSVKITGAVIEKLKEFIPLDPLHQPHNLTAVEWLQKRLPNAFQVACFDTSFHSTQSDLACMFALPRNLTQQGIRRYGFHGLSCEYITSRLPEFTNNREGKYIIAHLGSGSSLTAIKDQKSVYTTTGFSTLEGLVMATRTGTIDPGVILYLLEEKKQSLSTIKEILYNRSGLLGVSGFSGDMEILLQSENPNAKEAIRLYVFRINQYLGTLYAILKGIDGLIFTGGIGENSPAIRRMICEEASWLKISLDEKINEHQEIIEKNKFTLLTRPSSSLPIWVLPTDEEKVIAESALKVFNGSPFS